MTRKEKLLNQIEIERNLQTAMNKNINKAVNKINEEIRQIEAEEMLEIEKSKKPREECTVKIIYVKTDLETMVADLIEILLIAGVYSDKAPKTSDRATWSRYREQIAREIINLLHVEAEDEAT